MLRCNIASWCKPGAFNWLGFAVCCPSKRDGKSHWLGINDDIASLWLAVCILDYSGCFSDDDDGDGHHVCILAWNIALLSLSVWGWRLIGERWRGASGVVSSLCIVTMGIYLMIARSTVDLPIPATLLNQAAASEGIATMPSDNLVQSDHLSSQQIASETG